MTPARRAERRKNRVIAAAVRCTKKYGGFAFLYARTDIKLSVIDRQAFIKLEEAVAAYRRKK